MFLTWGEVSLYLWEWCGLARGLVMSRIFLVLIDMVWSAFGELFFSDNPIAFGHFPLALYYRVILTSSVPCSTYVCTLPELKNAVVYSRNNVLKGSPETPLCL